MRRRALTPRADDAEPEPSRCGTDDGVDRSSSRLRATADACRHALRLAWASAPGLALAQTLLVALQALLPLAAMFALKRAVDAAALLARQGLPAPAEGMPALAVQLLREPASRAVALWFVAGAAVTATVAVLRGLLAWVAEQHAMAVSDHVHGLLHAKLLEVDLAFFEDSRAQERLHLVQSQAMTRPVGVLGALYQLLRSAIALGGVLVLLALFQPLLALALALAGLPALLLRLHRSRRRFQWRRGLAPLEREAGYFHTLMSSGGAAKEARLNGFGGFCRERFGAARSRLREARLVWRRRVLGEDLLLQLLTLAVAAVLLLWMTGHLAAGALTLGSLVMYVQAVQRGQGQVGNLVTAVVDLHQAALFLTTFEEVLRQPARVTAPAHPRPVPALIREGIVFDRVGFTYPGTGRPVLHNLSFTLGAGERLAVVGANGAGKSTLVKLLCRLYDPTAGRILVDGIDLRNLDPAAWRQRVGVLFQDFGRYQLTAAENIWIGDPQGAPADARVAAAAARAGLDEIVRHWPQGLDTPLGRWLRPGVEPSMGQWQRLALARVFLREARLLVLDEPTSALDARTQQALIRLLQRESAERPALVVSHRPEMLAWARRVIVLREGTVVEEGDAGTLLRQRGEFARLYPEAGGPPVTV